MNNQPKATNGALAEDFSGVQFVPALRESERGKQGRLALSLSKPQFHNLEEMAVAIGNLDVVDARKVATVDEAAGTADYIDGYRAIKSKKTGKVYSIKSKQYVPVQDSEIAQPCYEAARELGLETMGSIHGVGIGQTTGYVIFSNVDALDLGVTFGEGHNFVDLAGVGVTFHNSYTGETSMGGKMFIHRRCCSNLLAQGELLGEWKIAHKGELRIAANIQAFKRLITDGIKRCPDLIKTIERAREVPVIEAELPDLLWGIGNDLPMSAIDAIVASPARYTPEIIPGKLNVWNVHNTITSWASWLAGGTNSPRMLDRVSTSANELLTKDTAKLIEQGRERREKYHEALKARQDAKVAKEKAAREAVMEAVVANPAGDL
jgi:hypothetical protein